MERRGPLVHRAVRYGAWLLIAAGALLLLANIVPAIAYSGFSVTQTTLAQFGQIGGSATSAGSIVFDLLLAAFGVALLFGAWMIWSGLPARGSRTIGLLLLMLSGVAAIVVAAFPTGTPQNVGGVNSAMTAVLFLAAGFSLLVLTLAMLRDRRWDGLRLYTLLSGVVVLVAFLVYNRGLAGALGAGGAERIAVAPIILWLIVVGIHLVRIPVYAASHPTPSAP